MPDLRVVDFWNAIVVQLSTARMTTILGGAGRVIKAKDDTGIPWTENAPGGRIVLVGTTTLWPDVEHQYPGETRKVSFLVLSEANNFTGQNYDVSVTLEAAQSEAYAQLVGWTPVFSRSFVAMPLYRNSPPQTAPQWDERGGRWYLSSEWRTELSPNP